jgi:ComF family protein
MSNDTSLGARGLWPGRLLDFVLPHRCFACDRGLGEGPGLCPSCWAAVTFIEAPCCKQCGRPFEIDPNNGDNGDDGLICAKCIADPPLFDRARAAMVYNDASRSLVTGLKYADRTDFAKGLGLWLQRAGSSFLDDADVLVPVPLHPWRLWMRRYNQAGLLAGSLSRETLIPTLHDAIHRTRHTRQQVGLSAAKRRRNVAGAFRINPKRRGQIEGAHVVLIDDVVTSGATILACTRALRALKPREISILSLARTLS